MSFRTDDLQAARFLRGIIQLNIRTTARHVRGNGYCPVHTGIRNDFRFQLMELRVQYLMRDSLPFQKPAQLLGSLNRNRTNQYRLSLCMGCLHRFHDRMQLFFPRLIHRILLVKSQNGLIRGNLNNIHSIDITEFLFLGEGGTCHT